MTEEAVNHPNHYNQYDGFEVIDVAEQLVGPDGKSGFNLGNAFKYIARAGWKNPDKQVEDLEKAKFYIQREIDRLSRINEQDKTNEPTESIPKFVVPREMIGCEVCGGDTTPSKINSGWLECLKCKPESLRFAPKTTKIVNPDADLAVDYAHGLSPVKYATPICPDCQFELRRSSDDPNEFSCENGHGTMRIRLTYNSWMSATKPKGQNLDLRLVPLAVEPGAVGLRKHDLFSCTLCKAFVIPIPNRPGWFRCPKGCGSMRPKKFAGDDVSVAPKIEMLDAAVNW